MRHEPQGRLYAGGERMSQYAIKFSKEGYICYTSHLDMLRLFKRALKKAGIRLSYSQGFNPHPKMGFAQPLSLGYSSICEYLELETDEDYEPAWLKKELELQMPEGVKLLQCQKTEGQKKSLAARAEEAEYIIGIPLKKPLSEEPDALCQRFLEQRQILVPKKQKKSKERKDVDIRGKIRLLNFVEVGENLLVTAILDCGSQSNLSPELLITALTGFFDIQTPRAEIDVMRTRLSFN